MSVKAQCLHCKDIIISYHHHDWVSCACFENKTGNQGIYLDGGNIHYYRAGGNLDNFKRLYDEDDGE